MRITQSTPVTLDGHYARFAAKKVASGRYRSASDVIRAGLRLLEDRQPQVCALRSELVAGEASGDPGHLDIDAFLADKRA